MTRARRAMLLSGARLLWRSLYGFGHDHRFDSAYPNEYRWDRLPMGLNGRQSAREFPNRAYWSCQIAGWGGYSLTQALAVSWVSDIDLPTAGLEYVAICTVALLATHGLRAVMHRQHWDTLRARELAPRIALAGIALGAPLGFVFNFMTIGALQTPDPAIVSITISPVVKALLHITNWSLLIAAWMTTYFVILAGRKRRHAELRQSELKRALQLAELRLLKSQLNPHFLFNSLNSVRALIADNPTTARDAVTRLAGILRYTLNAGRNDLATLEQELAIVNDYLALESLRLDERLVIECDIATDALPVRVPAMLLQTIAENAIKHGIAELPAGGLLRLSAHLRDELLCITMENPRPAVLACRDDPGLGLDNASQRLLLLFGEAASLELDLSSAERAITRVRIPVRS